MNEEYQEYKKMLNNVNIKNMRTMQYEKTIFEITKYPYRENVASNILAFYFDINEEHKLEDLFLNALLDTINSKYNESKSINTNNIKVFRELRTKENKRIDLVLLCDNTVIGIENKIGASLYNNLEQYYERLKEYEKEEIIAIVLSENKLKENEIDDIKKNKFINILYSDFFDKVDKKLEDRGYEENKWVNIYHEFSKTIRKRREKNMMIDEEFKNFYKENKSNISNFTNLLKQIKEILNNKVDKMQEEIEERISEKEKDELIANHYNYNRSIVIEKEEEEDLYTISNIYLKEMGITIDNVITPEKCYIQINIGNKQQKRILEILKNNNIECIEKDKKHVKLLQDYYENDKIIDKDFELIRLLKKYKNVINNEEN